MCEIENLQSNLSRCEKDSRSVQEYNIDNNILYLTDGMKQVQCCHRTRTSRKIRQVAVDSSVKLAVSGPYATHISMMTTHPPSSPASAIIIITIIIIIRRLYNMTLNTLLLV